MNKSSTPTDPKPAVYELRVSRIRFVSSKELIEGEPDPNSFGANVAREAAYTHSLQDALRNEGILDPPWPPGVGLFNNFWLHYLDTGPDNVAPEKAWRLFVPLRLSIPVGVPKPEGPPPPLRVVAKEPPGTLQIEAFLFPHGVAVVTRARLMGDYSLDEAVDAVRLLDEKKGLIFFENGEKDPHTYKLGFLEMRLLESLGRSIGWSSDHWTHRAPAFTIATVVTGGGVDPTNAVKKGDPIHLALEGLCSRDEGWRNLVSPPELEARLLPTKGATLGNLFYARDHERVVWQPSAFSRPAVKGKRQTKLGCYHRNLMQLSVQIESLLALMVLAARDLEDSGDFGSARLESLANSGAKLLGRLYGKPDGIYHSASVPRQIDAVGRRSVVDLVRSRLGEPPLFR